MNIMIQIQPAVGGYSVNPYVGCIPRLQILLCLLYGSGFNGAYRSVGHLSGRQALAGVKIPGSTPGSGWSSVRRIDGYNPQEERFRNTRKLLEQLRGSGAEILICTKSDLVLRDLDLLRSWAG